MPAGIRLLDHSNSVTRLKAIQGLAELGAGAGDAAPRLQEMLKSDAAFVRGAVIRALRRRAAGGRTRAGGVEQTDL